MVLVIQLHGNEVLTSVGGPSLTGFLTDGTKVPTFALSNIRFLCEAIGLGSGVYDQLVQKKLADTGVLELPFKDYSTVIDTHNQNTRFHISCQSLDRIWACFRPSDYNDKGSPVSVEGYVGPGGFVSATSANYSNAVEIGLPDYDRGGVLGINEEKYLGAYHDLVIESDATIQLQLNKLLSPKEQREYVGRNYLRLLPDWFIEACLYRAIGLSQSADAAPGAASGAASGRPRLRLRVSLSVPAPGAALGATSGAASAAAVPSRPSPSRPPLHVHVLLVHTLSRPSRLHLPRPSPLRRCSCGC